MPADHTEAARLTTLYRDLSDSELLTLHEDGANLTDEAQQALRAEIASRHLRVTSPAVESKPAEYVPDLVTNLHDDGLVSLITFFNGTDLALACDHLGDAGIELAVQPSSPSDIAPASYQIRVAASTQAEAEQVLRGTMGLFPLQETAGAYTEGTGYIDDGDMVILGEFQTLTETNQTATLLSNAGIDYRLTPPDDDGEQDDPGYSIEVHAADLDRGLEVVAKGLGLS